MSTDDDLVERVAWLERAVAQLSARSNPPIALPPKPGEDGSVLSPAVQELIRAGNTIQAVQQHRLDAGVGLAEAKAAVEAFAG